MAVIREQQQFQTAPIGVARASQGGVMVGNALARSGETLANMFYRYAAEDADEAGKEFALSIDLEEIRSINPKTGEPEAFRPPVGFGRIASNAYQNVVMQRFQSDVEEEMKLKARELAVQYEGQPGGADAYREVMGDYIAQMSQNATGQFRTFITDVGNSYLDQTATNLYVQQVRAERRAAARAQSASAAQGIDSLQAAVAMGGVGALGEQMPSGSIGAAMPQGFEGIEGSVGAPVSQAPGGDLPTVSFRGGSKSPVLNVLEVLDIGGRGAAGGDGVSAPSPIFTSPPPFRSSSPPVSSGGVSDFGDAGAALDTASAWGRMFMGTAQTVQSSIDAGLVNPRAWETFSAKSRMAIAHGLIENRVMFGEHSSAELTIARHAIGSQNPVQLLDVPGFEVIAELMMYARATGDMKWLYDLEKRADHVLGDAASAQSKMESLEADWLKEQEERAATFMALDLNNVRTTARNIAAENEMTPAGLMARISQRYDQFRQNYVAASPEMQSALKKSFEAEMEGYVEAMSINAMNGLSSEQADMVEAALLQRQPSLAPESARDFVIQALALDQIDSELREQAVSYVASYADKGGKLVAAQNAREQKLAADMTIGGDIRRMPFVRTDHIGGVIENGLSMLSEFQANGMKEKDAADMRKDLMMSGARALMLNIVGRQLSEAQMSEVQMLLRGSTPEQLTVPQDVAEMAIQANAYAEAAGLVPTLTSDYNYHKDKMLAQRRLKDAADNEARELHNIARGINTSPTSKAQQEMLDTLLNQNAGFDWLGSLTQYYSGDDAVRGMHPEAPQLIRDIQKSGVMPASLIASFDLFAATGQGDAASMVQTYMNLMSFEQGGHKFDHPVIQGLDDETRAAMDYLVASSMSVGLDKAAETLALYHAAKKDPQYKMRVQDYLGYENLNEFFRNEVEGFENLSMRGRQALEAYGRHYMGLAQSDGSPLKLFRVAMERHIEANLAVDGDGIVQGPLGETNTWAALGRTVGDNDALFADVALGRIRQSILNMEMEMGRSPDEADESSKAASWLGHAATWREAFGASASWFAGEIPWVGERDLPDMRNAVTLRPISPEGASVTVYQARRFNPDTDAWEIVYEKGQDGMWRPLEISTQDEIFLNHVEARSGAEAARMIEDARNIQRMRIEMRDWASQPTGAGVFPEVND